jgi:hypothetical protein
MNARPVRWLVTVIVVGLFSLLTAGCVVPGGEYGYGRGAGYGVGYYEPYGVTYGSWGTGYDVGPARGGTAHRYHGGGAAQHGFQAAPASRPMPSIPSRRRGGGGSRSRESGPHAHGSR